MNTCPYCQLGFHASYRVCPTCGKYEAPLEEFWRYLESEAQVRLDAGDSRSTVVQMLVSAGMAEDQAVQVVAKQWKKVAGRSRSHGFLRLFLGLACLVFGGIVLIFQIIPGLGLLVFGGLAFCSGLYSLLTGRESGIAAPRFIQKMFEHHRHGFGDDE
jgi:hypothetical protein